MVILLLLIYQLVSTGVTIHAHYCLGYLVDVSFFLEAESCGGNMTMPCCQDRTISIKIEDAQQVQETVALSPPIFLALAKTYLEVGNQDIREVPRAHCSEREIPPPDQPPFIAFHALLFYG
ncbi:MAG: hypothetical protein AAFR59_07665 [Bacteroidota bacterium]